jgi:3-methyladenine DNA glycosylase AlkD
VNYMNPLSEEIIAEACSHYNAAKAEASKRYFREPIHSLGLTMQMCQDIAGMFYPRVKGNLPLAIDVVGDLHRHGCMELAIVGDNILRRMKRRITPTHFNTFDAWVDTLSNWANTDTLCTGLIFLSIQKEPRLVGRLLDWTGSENRWRRRASVVSLVPIARRGDMLDDVFRTADRLMEDQDDMVQKGVGWLLKEASKKHPDEVREYLLKWRPKTSALVLRYASEKLPSDKRVLKRG